jgi:hypothetical protein
MSGHTLKITPPERKSPSQSFFSWISSHTYLFVGNLITIASSVIFICSLIYYSFHTEHLLGEFVTPSLVQYIIYWGHLVFIIYCIVYLLLVINTNDLEKERVREVRGVIFGGDAAGRALTLNKGQRLLKEFKIYFILFWISMFALYVAFIIGAHEGQADKEKYVASFAPRGNMVGDVLHVVGTSHDKSPGENAPVNVTEFSIDVTPTHIEKDASNAGKEKSPPITGRQEESGEKYVATFSVRKIGEGDSPHNEGAGGTEKPEKGAVVSVSEFKLDVKPVGTEGGTSNVGNERSAASNEDRPLPARYEQVKPFTTNDWKVAFNHVFPEFLPFALNTASLLFIFWCLSILYLPYQSMKEKLRHRRFLYLSSFFVVIIIVSYPLLFILAQRSGEYTQDSLLEYMTAFNAVSGTLNAVVLALLIARLDSKLIGLPSWLVSILYLYAAVQPLFVVFSQPGLINEIIKTFVLLFVFILKVYFFFIIIYAMQTGKMLNYLFCFPTLNKRIKAIFENHFEIVIREKNANSVNFTIRKNQSLVYKAPHDFPSREKCLAEIEQLKKLMTRRSSYKINPFGGILTVDIAEGENFHCLSVPQHSWHDANDLITESIDYIPYCGLNIPE